MKFLHWLAARTGNPVDQDGYYGPQCTDLVNDYLRAVWGRAGLAGNAIDFAADTLAGWTWVHNTPANRPSTGAIVVWGGPRADIGTSAAGHTAIALLSDTEQLLTFDQNFPVGHAPQQVRHGYAGVIGWHRPPSAVLDLAP